jgi:hypothetical protein
VQGKGEAEPARIVVTDEKTGQRRASVDVTITLASNTVGSGILGPEATGYLRSMIGGCESGLGRVESVEFLPDANADRRSVTSAALTIRARFMFVSRAA